MSLQPPNQQQGGTYWPLSQPYGNGPLCRLKFLVDSVLSVAALGQVTRREASIDYADLGTYTPPCTLTFEIIGPQMPFVLSVTVRDDSVAPPTFTTTDYTMGASNPSQNVVLGTIDETVSDVALKRLF